MLETIPKPPKHLGPATKRWWESVISRREPEQHHVMVLTAAAEAWDRMNQAREGLALNGLIYMEEKPKRRTARPEIAIKRDSRLAFLRAFCELDPDVEPPTPPSRTPALRSMRGKRQWQEG